MGHNLFTQQLHFRWSALRHMRQTCIEVQAKKKAVSSRALTIGVLVVTLLDIASGCSIAYVLLKNNFHTMLGELVSKYIVVMLESAEQLVTWLMGVPGGLKLNTPLDHFLGTKFLAILEFGKNIYLLAEPCTWWIVTTIALSSFGGLTTGLTLLHDFLNLLNLCTICLFVFATRMFFIQLSALKSLARLFMGKKWNKLRTRVDSCDFDRNRLLLGTIVFTILLFLLPTTGMYYLVFASLRVLQLAVQTPLRLGTLLVNQLAMMQWSIITSALDEEPIERLRLCLKYSCDNVRATAMDIHVYGTLNGKEYSLQELKDLVTSLPVEEIHYPNRVTNRFQHYMLSWDWVGWLSLW